MSFPGSHVMLTQAEVRTETTDKRHRLGTVGRTLDGRVYRYALAGEALSIGIPLVQQAAHGFSTPADRINDTEDITTTFGAVQLSSTWSTDGALANEFADGYFVIEDSTQTSAPQGQLILILSNTAGSTSTTDSPLQTVITFDPESRLTVTVDTDDSVYVVPSMYFDVIEHDGGADPVGSVVGVPNISVLDNGYFWAQTWGVCPVLQDGSWVYGENVIPSTQTDQGAQAVVIAELAATDSTTLTYQMDSTNIQRQIAYQKIGFVIGQDAGDGDWGLLFLTISP